MVLKRQTGPRWLHSYHQERHPVGERHRPDQVAAQSDRQAAWTTLRAVADRTSSVMDQANYVPQGTLELREAVAALYSRRIVPTHSGHIVITSGAQQAINPLAETWLRSGSTVAVENPSYLGAMHAFRFHGGHLVNGPAAGSDDHAPSGLAGVARRATPDLVYMMLGCNYISGRPIPALVRGEIHSACAGVNVRLIEDEIMTHVILPSIAHPKVCQTLASQPRRWSAR